MSQAVAKTGTDISNIEKLIINGDLSRLSAEQRMQYYRYRCESMKLDPMSRPFDYLELQGKLILYLNRGGGEQLRRNNNVSVIVTDKITQDDVITVYVRATMGERTEDDCGAVALKGGKGDAFANAQMKAVTKAKRRAAISICSLGMIDESELETIPGAKRIPFESVHDVKSQPKPELVVTSPVAPPPVVKKEEPTFVEQIAEVIRNAERPSAETVIPYGSLKGKKLGLYDFEEWGVYLMKVKEALLDPKMPQKKREEAVELIELIESYIHG